MCLITEQKRVKILRKDLTVYKRFYDGGVLRPWSLSYRDKFVYTVGVVHKQPLCVNNIYGGHHDLLAQNAYHSARYENFTNVHDGFHSALKLKRLGVCQHYYIDYVCVIPKGSKVFKDKTGLIVSNQIILKEKICV